MKTFKCFVYILAVIYTYFSYQKVFADVKNASESPLEVQPFTRPTEVRPLQTIQGNPPQADSTFQTIKKGTILV